MTAEALCLALTMATQTFGPLPAENLELACEQAGHLIEASEEHGFEPTLMAGLIYIESRWTADAVSRAGACGLTQVIPRFVEETCTELKQPVTSITAGARSLKKWMTMRVRRNGRIVRVPRTGGVRTALACYNAGNACAKSSRGRAYANMVLRYKQRLDRIIEQNREDAGNADRVQPQQHMTPTLTELYHPVNESSAESAFYSPLYIVGSL